MKTEEPKIVKRTVIPIQIADSSSITTALNFHKAHGSEISPASIKTNLKKVKISYRNESEKAEDAKRFREVKSYEMAVSSNKFPDSRFNAEIPYDIKQKDPQNTFFALKVGKQSGVMKILDGYAEMSEKILEKRAVNLTFNQRMKIQESMLDNRMRRELTEREAMEMFDDDTDGF